MKQESAPEWKGGLPTRQQQDNKVIRCMIRDNYGHAKPPPRHVMHTACLVQVEFVSLRTEVESMPSSQHPRGDPLSAGGCNPSGTTCKDPPSFPGTANLLAVRTTGSLRQVQGRHGASFACEGRRLAWSVMQRKRASNSCGRICRCRHRLSTA